MPAREKTFQFEPSPFREGGSWLKAGFHCHTVHSDGGLTPEDTVAAYRAKRYDCVCITDHRKVTPVDPASLDGCVTIDATENGGMPDLIGIGVQKAAPHDLPFPERVAILAEQGGFVIAAHPTYCAATPESYAGCPGLDALEICNAYCDEAYANGLATELWDMLLGKGKRLWGVAADDAHLNPDKGYFSDAGHAWVQVWAGERTPEAVLAALKAGAFYASQGPSFERIDITDQSIRVACSPVAEVRWRTLGSAGHVHRAREGAPLTESVLPEWFKPRVFVRVELMDSQGKRAWSNPVFLAK